MFGKKQKSSGRRTTSGAERANTYYYKQGSDPETASASSGRARGELSWWHNVPAYIATIVIAGCLVFSLLLNTSPKIIIINDQDAAIKPFLRSKETYQSIVQKQLSSSILNRSKLTFNSEKVADEVGLSLSEATEVSITLPIIGRNPVVYLRIAEPAFVLTNESNSFVIDEQGRAVVQTSELPDSDFAKQLLLVSDLSGVAIEAGKQALTKEQVAFISTVQQLLGEKKVSTGKMMLPAKANELHVYPKGEKYYIKYNFLLDPVEQTGKYAAVKQQLNKENATPKQYIDVRVEDRAYVR